jgi:DNA-binding response OmpR family regulator
MAKILLIDDERDVLVMLAEVLAREGHHVTALSSGVSLLQSVGADAITSRFDLVITDVMLPDVNGLDIIRALKAGHPSVLTIAMSGGVRGVGPESWDRAAMNAGATTTLTKPFSMSDLRRVVAHTLVETNANH